MTNFKWQVSPLNFIPKVQIKLRNPANVIFNDCTLREGEQQPGVVLNRDDKIRLAHALDDLGIQQLEAGMPAVSREEARTISALAKENLSAKLVAVVRSRREEIDTALDCGVWGLTLSIPFGQLQIEHKLGWSRERIIETTIELAAYAKSKGVYVILSPYDTTRADMGFLEEFLIKVCAQGNIDRVRLVDTVGSASPMAIAYLVRKMLEFTGGLPIEAHCHNDFGLATANTLAAIAAGASVASTTLNGMGERSGGAATEEVAMALLVLYRIDTGLKCEGLYAASKLLQELSNVSLQPHKAVVGANTFAEEAGLIVGGLVKHPFTALPYLPELVGQTMQILLGKKSGKASIKLALEQANLKGTDDQVEEMLQRVKELAQTEKRTIGEEEFTRLAQKVLAQEVSE